ncbi:MAG: VRR-NUC domain-containing protein [Bacillota bacterium]
MRRIYQSVNHFRETEHSMQSTLFKWARLYARIYPELAYIFAIPNGAKLPWRRNKKGQRYCPEALRLLEEGMKSGVPDIFLPKPKGDWHGLFIEMKRAGNKVTKEQDEFIDYLVSQKYRCRICFSFEEAQVTILDYLKE